MGKMRSRKKVVKCNCVPNRDTIRVVKQEELTTYVIAKCWKCGRDLESGLHHDEWERADKPVEQITVGENNG